MDWVARNGKIFDSYDILRKMLSKNTICCESYIEIFDPPYTVKLIKEERKITFSENGKKIAILDNSGLKIHTKPKKEIIKIVDEWCIALTSLGFKRYSLKTKQNHK